MTDQIPQIDDSNWLAILTPNSIKNEPFPLLKILRNSLYYPCSDFDGKPVKFLGGNIASFVYVDYGNTSINTMEQIRKGFRGYELLADSRSITKQELAPRGWDPIPPNLDDGNPTQHRDHIKEPFCFWTVFRRRDDFPVSHGPRRFSLLYLCADGVAAFQALYIKNRIAPQIVALIAPGHGFGMNYTDFTDREKIFARSVLDYNLGGKPELLLYDGYGHRDYNTSCWEDYSVNIRSFRRRRWEGYQLVLWAQQS